MKSRERVTPVDLDALQCFDSIIDVRSPGEFALDHIPGSSNQPVLDDAERDRVDAHLATCDACARNVGDAEAAIAALVDRTQRAPQRRVGPGTPGTVHVRGLGNMRLCPAIFFRYKGYWITKSVPSVIVPTKQKQQKKFVRQILFSVLCANLGLLTSLSHGVSDFLLHDQHFL